MPFRDRFDCLWCGRAWSTDDPDALEGWAQLCPDCLGRAGDNGFLRSRLHAAISERGRAHGTGETEGAMTPRPAAARRSLPLAAAPGGSERVAAAPSTDGPVAAAPAASTRVSAAPGTHGPGATPRDAMAAGMVAYYEARAPEYDDWYLRRGRYDHGTIDNQAWSMELDQATVWLDGLPWAGRIVELAAGTGWWSPLLASKGELWCYDAATAPLDRARERLLAHRLRAHLHVRDAWDPPEPPPADGLFAGFWLSHVPRDRLAAFLGLCRSWLRPGGQLAFIDSRPDPASGSSDRSWDPTTETSLRRLSDGRAFRVPKVYYRPDELTAALEAAGFAQVRVGSTARFFLLGEARAGQLEEPPAGQLGEPSAGQPGEAPAAPGA
jgi:SAM-dependent methyltransferase